MLLKRTHISLFKKWSTLVVFFVVAILILDSSMGFQQSYRFHRNDTVEQVSSGAIFIIDSVDHGYYGFKDHREINVPLIHQNKDIFYFGHTEISHESKCCLLERGLIKIKRK